MLHGIQPAWFTACTDSVCSVCAILEKRKCGEEVHVQIIPGGCWYAAGTLNSSSFHILLISSILLPSSRLSEPFCHSSSTLPFCPPPVKLENCSEAVVSPSTSGLCLFPAPLKRLLTQASNGPRLWKLLIEDRSQPRWQTQGHLSFVAAVFFFCSCLCGGLRESVQLLGAVARHWAMVITCHSSHCFRSLPWPSPAKKLTACALSS